MTEFTLHQRVRVRDGVGATVDHPGLAGKTGTVVEMTASRDWHWVNMDEDVPESLAWSRYRRRNHVKLYPEDCEPVTEPANAGPVACPCCSGTGRDVDGKCDMCAGSGAVSA
jgi:hypothetical protein